MLVGRYPETTVRDSIAGYIALILICVILLPWIAIAAGCILLGVHGIARGEPSVIIGLPAGIALLFAGPLLLYLKKRWYPPICQFDFDGQELRYAFRENQIAEIRSVNEVCKVVRRKGAKAHKTWGYDVMFEDRSWIHISRSLTNADELYEALSTHLAERLRSVVEQSGHGAGSAGDVIQKHTLQTWFSFINCEQSIGQSILWSMLGCILLVFAIPALAILPFLLDGELVQARVVTAISSPTA